MFKGTVRVTSSDSLCKDGKCPIFNGTLKTLISTKICNIMSNSGLKTLIFVNFFIGSYKQQIRKNHFRRETANENKQFKNQKYIASNS